MSDEFRYNEPAEALEDNLEDVLESHQKEQEEKQAAETASLPKEPPALERIARGTALDQVNQVIESREKKASSAVLAEHRVRGMLREGQEARVALVDDFLEAAAE